MYNFSIKGVLYGKDDVVNVLGQDGGVYYAKTRGFIRDVYCNNFVALTWLLPKKPIEKLVNVEFSCENFVSGKSSAMNSNLFTMLETCGFFSRTRRRFALQFGRC